MATHVKACSFSITRKYWMALTGAAWSFFALTHMAGNMLIFAGADAYNLYTYKMVTNPLLPLAETGLVVLLLGHIYFALSLTIENKRARPDGYHASASGAKAVTLASRTMPYTGFLILAFIISHLITFKYGTHYTTYVDGVEMRDMHQLIVEVFQMPAYIAWYVVALLFLGLHLRHGVSSIFQSLGINHPRFTPWIKKLGVLYAIVVIAGFLSQPIYVFLNAR